MTKRELIDLLEGVPDDADITLDNGSNEAVPVKQILHMEKSRSPCTVELLHAPFGAPGMDEDERQSILDDMEGVVLFPTGL